ncbi:hypothetical protein G3I29_16360 [Streptomyces halstedii]|uniref:Uncharacterized protein n=1 Tax=Streptomyces halstedii TaxID=1944 RepID=A0A6N9U002_STRHA|nr:hypothetical protein [Streptomyces halstedii]
MITAAASLTGTLVTAGVLLFLYWPQSPDDDKDAGRPTVTASSPSDDRGAAPSTGADATPVEDTQERAVDLLTPDGARQVVKGLEKVMGGTRVTDFTLYGEHASADAPLATNPKLYDRYTYREGRAERDNAGGTLSASDTSVDLEKVDWDKLPSLLADAEKSLNIPDPDSRYLIVDPASPFHGDRPVLRVYVSDDYGGAFLTAELDGKIIERNPRDAG